MEKIELKNYKAPDFSVTTLDLHFDLHEDFCRVKARMQTRKTNPNAADLVLDGVGIELESVKINNEAVPAARLSVTPETLTISGVPNEFILETSVLTKPQENTSLEGLYRSNGMFTTQCEAQGFRKVTYFLDRPDVMTSFTVTIEADRKKYPLLLSNGDRLRGEEFENGRHAVTWHDPHKKPCYLFALVAGDLGVIKDTFTTASGKKVDLEIYSAHGSQERCRFAMESLKKSMRWDEERFGREYDLATYMIVAVDDFNAGAMENKGLNIFNSRLVLADPKTATDANYFAIESVIAHEYFHNWTGNRVTLRDWFHLSLKEGLTVFRDQEFSMDLHSRPMVRIETVADLRDSQFAEDAGPNAHPIRPESCFAVDNFFTSTIYEKGAEVIRMMQTMVGRPGFREGMDLYFKRHDGQAVIIEDFAAAISEPNKQDWSQFKRWYSQAGTPVVKATESYDSSAKKFLLTLEQSCPPSPGQDTKEAFHIPLVIGLLDPQGRDLPLNCAKAAKNTDGETLLNLKATKETYEFTGIDARPVLSLNRGFSAPIHLMWDATEPDLLFLLAHDSDAFNRWEAGQKLMLRDLSRMIQDHRAGRPLKASGHLIQALGRALADPNLDMNMKGKLIALPSDSYLSQLEDEYLAESFDAARVAWETDFARAHEKALLEIYKAEHGKYDAKLDQVAMASRSLKNAALGYLSWLPEHANLVARQLQTAAHMTDYEIAAAISMDLDGTARKNAIGGFLAKWKSDALTMNKWFSLQSMSRHPDTSETVKALWTHPEFNAKNPNRVYSLLARWGDNLVRFHEGGGKHYQWMADRILELDRMNPQVATRVAGCFDLCTKVSPQAKDRARKALDSILKQNPSKNSFEILSRTRASLD